MHLSELSVSVITGAAVHICKLCHSSASLHIYSILCLVLWDNFLYCKIIKHWTLSLCFTVTILFLPKLI